MILRFFYSFIVVLVLVACAQNNSEPEMSTAEAEKILHERFKRMTDRTSMNGLPFYDPLVLLEGSENWHPLPRAEKLKKTIPESAISDIEDYADKNNSSALIVWRNGVVESERYFGDTTADTEIVSKSLAKPISVLAVGRAIAEGHIDSLDQPVADFIHEWRGTPKEKMLIRDLLGMRSGLLPQSDVKSADDVLMRAYLHPFFEDVIINEYPLVNEPGTRYDYANAVADLVAPLIERATGRQYEDWIANELLKPLGARGGKIWMGRLGGTPHAGCCALLPAEDYLRTAILVLQDGVWEGKRLLPTGFVTEISTPTKENPHAGMGLYIGSPYTEGRGAANPDIAYGKTFHSEPYQADDLVLFDGNSNQVAYIVPSKKLVILRTGAWAPREPKWDNTFIPNKVLRSLDTDVRTDTDKSAKARPRFSDAIRTLKPLGKIKGNPRPLPTSNVAAESTSVDFTDAINYASELGSYSLLVWHQGGLILERYFEDFDADLRPNTASMHKSVMALLVATAIEDGYIKSVDEPIENYVDAWKGLPEGKITIKNVLNMASGLKPLSIEGGIDSPRVRFVTQGQGYREALLDMRLEVKPGSRFTYANTNSQIVAMVIESAVHKPYGEYLSERLWTRLGSSDAYTWNYNDGTPRTYTALLATAIDWLRVGILIKDKGQIYGDQVISADLINEMSTPSVAYPNYGWQVWLGNQYEEKRFYNDAKTGVSFSATEPFYVDDMIYFDGIGGQRVYISRKQDLVIVRTGDQRFDWDDTKLPNLIIDAIKQP
ncbi:serine hydrolase domain-containing protein [Aliiglaciecola sp. SL4]|uniref:serine hydrolase domain-containing protein n=1 Tax=Aliiglaciecola sp. SL4 TaxID=3239806 RepID=UPI00355B2B21